MAEEHPAKARVPFVYSNAVHFGQGPFDITMDFGMHPVRPHQGDHFQHAVRVVMSMSHAKSMLKVLADRIADYEERFGIIPSPHYPVAGQEDGYDEAGGAEGAADSSAE